MCKTAFVACTVWGENMWVELEALFVTYLFLDSFPALFAAYLGAALANMLSVVSLCELRMCHIPFPVFSFLPKVTQNPYCRRLSLIHSSCLKSHYTAGPKDLGLASLNVKCWPV